MSEKLGVIVDGDAEGLDNPSSPRFRLNGNWFVGGFSNVLLGSAGAANGDEPLESVEHFDHFRL